MATKSSTNKVLVLAKQTLQCGAVSLQLLAKQTWAGFLLLEELRQEGRVGVGRCQRWGEGRPTPGTAECHLRA